MELKPGSRWKSTTCNGEVVVVRPPRSAVTLECGGRPMIPVGGTSETAEIAGGHDKGTMIGKRYADAESGLEVLSAKAGLGSLSANGRPMPAKEAQALPSSD